MHPVIDRKILNLILEAVESYNLEAIRECPLMNKDSKEIILNKLQMPLSLTHLCRLKIRKLIEISCKETNSAQQNIRKQLSYSLLEKNQKIRNDLNVRNGADCEQFGLTPEQLQHINQMTTIEIQHEFKIGPIYDDYRFRMFAYLI